MKKVYSITDQNDREMLAEMEDGRLKVTMIFYPEETLTMEEVCISMGWTITESNEYKQPQLLPFKQKD